MNTKTNLLDWNWHTNTLTDRDHNEHAENAWHAWYSTPPSYSHSHAHSLISKTFIIPIHSLGLDRPRRFQFSTNAQQFTITHTHRKYLQKKKREWESQIATVWTSKRAKMFICFCWPKIQFNVWNVNICTQTERTRAVCLVHIKINTHTNILHTDVYYGIVEKSERHRLLWFCFFGSCVCAMPFALTFFVFLLGLKCEWQCGTQAVGGW